MTLLVEPNQKKSSITQSAETESPIENIFKYLKVTPKTLDASYFKLKRKQPSCHDAPSLRQCIITLPTGIWTTGYGQEINKQFYDIEQDIYYNPS